MYIFLNVFEYKGRSLGDDVYFILAGRKQTFCTLLANLDQTEFCPAVVAHSWIRRNRLPGSTHKDGSSGTIIIVYLFWLVEKAWTRLCLQTLNYHQRENVEHSYRRRAVSRCQLSKTKNPLANFLFVFWYNNRSYNFGPSCPRLFLSIRRHL